MGIVMNLLKSCIGNFVTGSFQNFANRSSDTYKGP